MDRVCVIGDKNTILPFKVLGLDVFSPDGKEEIEKIIDDNRDIYGVIFITEDYASLVNDKIQTYKSKIKPAIILIPDSQGTSNNGMNAINENMEKAIGTDIF